MHIDLSILFFYYIKVPKEIIDPEKYALIFFNRMWLQTLQNYPRWKSNNNAMFPESSKVNFGLQLFKLFPALCNVAQPVSFALVPI
jgi:hypothetical protein